MRALNIAFATLALMNIGAIFFLDAVHGVALTLIVPILLEYIKTSVMIGLAEKKRQASAALTLTLEAVKFAVIVTVLLACMAYTDRDNRSYEMMYCADFVIAQALGAIIYSIRVSKMEKKESV